MQAFIQLIDAGTDSHGVARRVIRVYSSHAHTGYLEDRCTLYGSAIDIGKAFAHFVEIGFLAIPTALTNPGELARLKLAQNALHVESAPFQATSPRTALKGLEIALRHP